MNRLDKLQREATGPLRQGQDPGWGDRTATLVSGVLALLAVVEALPRCDDGLPGPRCPNMATKDAGGGRFCDAHGPTGLGWDLPYAGALRSLLVGDSP